MYLGSIHLYRIDLYFMMNETVVERKLTLPNQTSLWIRNSDQLHYDLQLPIQGMTKEKIATFLTILCRESCSLTEWGENVYIRKPHTIRSVQFLQQFKYFGVKNRSLLVEFFDTSLLSVTMQCYLRR